MASISEAWFSLSAKHGVAAPGQGRRDGEVGEVAGGKSQSARKAGEGGDFLFQLFMRRQMAADQMRSAAASPPLNSAFS